MPLDCAQQGISCGVAGDGCGGVISCGFPCDAGSGAPPPPRPDGGLTTSGAALNFAVHELYLGDDDETPSFTPDPNAWKGIGYDLDGLVTTAQSTDVCTPYTRGVTAQQIDGYDGVDNAFGDIIVPALGMLGINLSQSVSEKISAGAYTYEIDTMGLSGSTTQTATGLGGQFFVGASYGGSPPLTGTYFSLTDRWPVGASLLNGTTVASGSKITFPGAYVSGGTWVSGTPVTLPLALQLEGQALALTVHGATITFRHAIDGSGQSVATDGVIAGVLDTAEFLQSLNEAVGALGSPPGSYCSLISIIESTIAGAQDILLDPSTGAISNRAGTPCNAISIGIGFQAEQIAAPSIVAPVADAGTPPPACHGVDAG